MRMMGSRIRSEMRRHACEKMVTQYGMGGSMSILHAETGCGSGLRKSADSSTFFAVSSGPLSVHERKKSIGPVMAAADAAVDVAYEALSILWLAFELPANG
jgi:hypothetical protein